MGAGLLHAFLALAVAIGESFDNNHRRQRLHDIKDQVVAGRLSHAAILDFRERLGNRRAALDQALSRLSKMDDLAKNRAAPSIDGGVPAPPPCALVRLSYKLVMEQTIAAPGQRAIRPRDAATLIIVRQSPDAVSVLMGRRSSRSVFMPGKVVFPGGRVEARDRSAAAADSLDPSVESKLLKMSRKIDAGRARAIAMAAIRETFEETGVMIGAKCPRSSAKASGPAWQAFADAGIAPSIGGLCFFSRAITPPGPPRRFDARFFVVSADAIALTAEPLDRELEEPVWLTIQDARSRNLPRITHLVLDDLEGRIRNGQLLDPAAPAVFRRPTRSGVEVATIT